MNPALVIELLRIGSQLLATMNQIKAHVEATDPALWKTIAEDFNKAASEFTGEPK